MGLATVRGRFTAFDVGVQKPIRDPFGHVRSAAEATGLLNRRDWGLAWNQVLEAGALLVGDEVRFTPDLQAVAAQESTVRAA